MTKRCILHFGLHKTGSTSIQRFLRRNLADPNFLYPESGTEPFLRDDCHNRAIIASFRSDPEKYHAHTQEGINSNDLNIRGDLFKGNIYAAGRDLDSRHLILSAEELSNFSEQDIQRLVDFLRALCFEAIGIGYVREYKRLQESRFQQALRIPGSQGNCLPPTDERFTGFLYRKKIEKFLKILGRKKVTLRRFKPSALEEGCVVRDFCKHVGISQCPTDVIKENKSLSLNSIRLLYSYRKFNQGADRGSNYMQRDRLLCEKLAELGGGRAAFHSTLFLKSEPVWRADVDWISNFLGEDMLGDLYADDEKECVRSEEDLFQFSPESLEWLASESQIKPSRLKCGSPHVVAEAVGRLQRKLMGEPTESQDFWTRFHRFFR